VIPPGKPRLQSMSLLPWLLLVVTLLSACATTPSPEVRRRTADQLARSAGLNQVTVDAEGFALRAYLRAGAPGQPLTVYIEGDGYAWKTRHQPSDDPTPTDPLALRLAAKDPSSNVAYLARPCQYVIQDAKQPCSSDYWTGKRYAEEVIVATEAALTQLRAQVQAGDLHLVGYSGGAAVAALAAARRHDVLSLRTVAGNLDHVALTTWHGVSGLQGSLNAIDETARLSSLPQRHFVGAQDRIVPPDIAQRFVARLETRRCAAVDVVESASHDAGWTEAWPQLLTRVVTCLP
jgi:hypothetical protein